MEINMNKKLQVKDFHTNNTFQMDLKGLDTSSPNEDDTSKLSIKAIISLALLEIGMVTDEENFYISNWYETIINDMTYFNPKILKGSIKLID